MPLKSGKTSNVHASRLAGGQFYLVASGGSIALPASTISAAEFDAMAAQRALQFDDEDTERSRLALQSAEGS